MGKAQSVLKGKFSSWGKEKSNDGKLTLTPDPNNCLEDQILGTIYGNCIGDAIGLMTEFLNKEQATNYYSGKHLEYPMKEITAAKFLHQWAFPEADWTDDSDQMILILQSLIDNDGKAVPTDFASKLIGWLQHGFPELGDTCGMGVGRTTWKVIQSSCFRTDPHKAAMKVWEDSKRFVAPNGGVMRTSIVGIHQYDDIEQVMSNAESFCRVTHADPRCVASCVAVTTAVAMMLQGVHRMANDHYDVTSLTEAAFGYAKEYLLRDEDGNLDTDQIEDLRFHMNASLAELELDDKKKIGYTFKCLGAGFWALRQDNFRTAIQDLILEGGDADTNGAVAGALLGCKLGYSNLPPSWKNDLKHKIWLDDILVRYFKMGTMTSGTPVDEPHRALPNENRGDTRMSATSEADSNEIVEKTVDSNANGDILVPSEEVRDQSSSVSDQLANTDAKSIDHSDMDTALPGDDVLDRSEVKPNEGSPEVTDQSEVKGQSGPSTVEEATVS